MIKYKVINEDGSTYETLEMPTSGVFETIEELPIEVVEVPQKISRMKFIIQINRSTGIKYEDIEVFINNIPNEYLNENEKYEIISRLKAAVDFERHNTDLLTIAQMMDISSEQLDEIFINGNLIN